MAMLAQYIKDAEANLGIAETGLRTVTSPQALKSYENNREGYKHILYHLKKLEGRKNDQKRTAAKKRP